MPAAQTAVDLQQINVDLKNKSLVVVGILAVLCLLFFFTRFQQRSSDTNNQHPGPRNQRDGLDRSISDIVYTKHARCRMDCRSIDRHEVKEILEKGIINYEKSEPAGQPDPKYALEGITHDGQQVRIIFAMAKQQIVVITVIDLEKEWACNCK